MRGLSNKDHLSGTIDMSSKSIATAVGMIMFYVLCFMFYVLCFMFYVLCFMFYVLCFMFLLF
jgi:hypothetical protein